MKKLNIAVLSVLFFGIALLLLLAQRPTESETEKRKLNEFPEYSSKSLLSGEYTNGIRLWYDDTVPFRDDLKDMCSLILEWTGIRIDDVKFYGQPINVENETEEEQTETETEKDTKEIVDRETETQIEDETEPLTEAETEPPEPEDDGMITDNILVYKKRAINLYGGSLSNAERYAGYMNDYKAALGDGVNVWSMTIPTAVSYYLPEKYKSYTRDQLGDIEHMRECYDGVGDIDVYSVLQKHVKEDIYLRTDHHWQPLGAYYAAEKLCSTLGVPFTDIDEYEKITVEGYVGSMYGYTNDSTLLKNPDTFIYYKPRNDYKCYYYDLDGTNGQKGNLFFKTSVNGSYCAVMGTDKTVVQIVGDNKNGRKLLMIKDSYGNAMVPFLTGSFEEIWIVDMRYFEANPIHFSEEHGITDVLVASCMFSACGGNAKHLDRLRGIAYELPTSESQTEYETQTGD